MHTDDITLIELRRQVAGFRAQVGRTVVADFVTRAGEHLEWALERPGERFPASWYIGRAKSDLRMAGRSAGRDFPVRAARAFELADLAEVLERRV
jgi:hypothetical protein